MGRLKESEEVRQRDVFVSTTIMMMAKRGITKRDVASYIRVSYPTLLKRFETPGSFQFDEMQGVAKLLNVKLQSLMDGSAARGE